LYQNRHPLLTLSSDSNRIHPQVLPWVTALGSLEEVEKHAVTSLKGCSLNTEGLIGIAEDCLHCLPGIYVLQELHTDYLSAGEYVRGDREREREREGARGRHREREEHTGMAIIRPVTTSTRSPSSTA